MRTIVFGAGYFGKAYIRELARNCVAIIEPDGDRAAEVNQAYGVPTFVQLDDCYVDYDAAVVCTPPHLHVPLALAVLKTGRKVLVEKPLARSVEELMPLRKFEDNLFAANIYLYHSSIQYLKTHLAFTPLDHVYCRRTNAGPVRDWQNAMWDLAPHDIAICNYLFNGTPISVQGTVKKDWANIVLEYPTVFANIYVSWFGGPKTRKIELVPAITPAERIIFDDMATTLSVSPLRSMLNVFQSEDWDARSSFETAMNIVMVLESAELGG